ncbi:hypothetical protein FDX24_05455 [Citrobacter sp. wls716]|uniref:lysozyme inhibitor LprI family protein n=1 Tax=Citrobacter sp. wls716 TaxID=2576420 RepID=UPI0010C9A5DC|nr:hypothetical protein [Citrobacter sp. wls716]TKU44009.1 hypothetical protein FDX24_05455 [Citrobacter sp. wls716]
MEKTLSVLALISIGVSLQASGASFDCSKAKSFSEKTICSSPKLSKYDDDLKYLYANAKESVKDRKAFSEITKALWNSRERCSDYSCVDEWYDSAFAIYGAIKAKGIPETNGITDIASTTEASPGEPVAENQKSNSSNSGDVTTVNPKVTYQLKNEAAFVDVIKKSMIDASNAKNDMQIGGVKSVRDKSICSILKVKSVSNWIGEVKNISANSDGKGVIALSLPSNITIKTWNNSLSDIRSNTLVEPGTDVFNSASGLNPGDVVYFSGTFFDDKDNCILEASLSLSGKVKEPEFIFKFSDIRKYRD